MNLQQLKQQKSLLEQKKIELDKIKVNKIHSQMNLRGGLSNRLQRKQDKAFEKLVKERKEDLSKKISSISDLISKTESGDILSSSSNQVNDFSILKTPKRRKVKRRGRIQDHIGFFLE